MSFQGDPGTEPSPAETTSGRRRDARLVIVGVLLGLGVWFAVANTQDVNVHFWVVTTRTPVVTALAIAAAFGAAIGYLASRRHRRPSS